MGRKNKNVGRSKDRRRYARQAAEAVGAPKRMERPQIRAEDMVLPDGQCLFQSPRRPKARFGTKPKADKALVQAQKSRIRSGSAHVEKRVYQCPEGGCGGWHLTSREEFDEKIWRQRRALTEGGDR